MYQQVAYGLLLPFVGTALGAATVFLLRDQIPSWLQKMLLGFASGVMMAASVWSLLIPAIDMTAESGGIAWLPAVLGFLAGMFSLLIFDTLVPHLHLDSDKPEGVKSGLGRSTMLVLAVTLHNIPEGMAIGAAYAAYVYSKEEEMALSALMLSIGIAIQNVPEGAIVSMPDTGKSRLKAFTKGVLSGVVEPIFVIVTVLLSGLIVPILPFMLSFAAGAMIYVVLKELVPEFSDKSLFSSGVVAFFFGFMLMMSLDVALG